MDQRIIYPTAGSIAVIIPADCGIPIEEIARKDTPAGVPYRVIDADNLPRDRTFRNAWTVDFGDPDGYGIGPEAWFAEQAVHEAQSITAADIGDVAEVLGVEK